MAHRWLDEGIAIAKEQDLQVYIAYALTGLGWMAHGQQDYTLAITRHRESLAIHHQLGNRIPFASGLGHLAGVLYDQHDYIGAQALYEESLAIFQEFNVEWEIADVLHYLGRVAQRQGDYPRAWALFRESLVRWQALGTLQWKGIAESLEGLADICALQRQFEASARLFGAAEVSRELRRATPSPLSRTSAENKLAALHAQLDEAAFVAAWAEGRRFTAEQAVDNALGLPDLSTSASSRVLPPPPTYPAGCCGCWRRD